MGIRISSSWCKRMVSGLESVLALGVLLCAKSLEMKRDVLAPTVCRKVGEIENLEGEDEVRSLETTCLVGGLLPRAVAQRFSSSSPSSSTSISSLEAPDPMR